MQFRRLAAIFVLLGAACACSGGSTAPSPVAPTTVPESLIAIPHAGGTVALPSAGLWSQALTFFPGSPVGEAMAVRAFDFSSATAAAAVRRASGTRRPAQTVCATFFADVVIPVGTQGEAVASFHLGALVLQGSGFSQSTAPIVTSFAIYDVGSDFIPYQPTCTETHNPQELIAQTFENHESFETDDVYYDFDFAGLYNTDGTGGLSTLLPHRQYEFVYAIAAALPGPSPSPTSSPTSAPTSTPTPAATATPTSAPTGPAATGTLSIANGTGNIFLGAPPANVGALSPSLFFNGTITLGASPESAPYTEWLGLPSHGCVMSGTVFYALELTTPNPFGFVATTPGQGFMDVILTTTGAATGEVFDESNCSILGGPSPMTASSGTLEFKGGDTQTVFAGHTAVFEASH
jgi:hypothetical protein